MRSVRAVALALVVLTLIGATACRLPVTSGPVTSRDDAVARVTALPDVAAWVKLVQTRSPANQVVVEVDSEDAGIYSVHAYELVRDELSEHSATFGWYEVDKASGVVRSTVP